MELPVSIAMSFNKRKLEGFPENEEDQFQVKKKQSLMSMDTTDSISKEDPNLSPIVLKPDHSEPLGTPDNKLSMGRKQSSTVKVASSHKKKHRSRHVDLSDEIKKKYMHDPALYDDHFKVVKYKNDKYNLNDCIMIRNEADAYNDFICKLIRIIKPVKHEPNGVLAFLEVQWYYKKEDLPKKYASIQNHLSVSEVFLSTHKDFVMVDCINGPGHIMNYSQFDKLEFLPPNTFFSRANYDIAKKKLEPPIEEWGLNCICRTPMNPDLNYIQCDKCDGWYHSECVGISIQEAEAYEQYFCDSCKGKEASGEIIIKQLSSNTKKKKIDGKQNKKTPKEGKEKSKRKNTADEQKIKVEQKLCFNITEEAKNMFQLASRQESAELAANRINSTKETNSIDNFEELFSTTTHHGATEQNREESNQELPEENDEIEEEGSSPKMDAELPEDVDNEFTRQSDQGFIFEFKLDFKEDVTKIFSEEFGHEEDSRQDPDQFIGQDDALYSNQEGELS